MNTLGGGGEKKQQKDHKKTPQNRLTKPPPKRNKTVKQQQNFKQFETANSYFFYGEPFNFFSTAFHFSSIHSSLCFSLLSAILEL